MITSWTLDDYVQWVCRAIPGRSSTDPNDVVSTDDTAFKIKDLEKIAYKAMRTRETKDELTARSSDD